MKGTHNIMDERRSRRKKKRSGLRILLLIASILLVGVGIYAWNFFSHLDTTTDEIYESVETEQVRESTVTLDSKEPISVLLLGVDTGEFGRTEQGRSDSMMVATVNPNTKKTTLLSIPRDTYTEIIGMGFYDKINHAYAFGGTSMAINTVQNMLNIPIDYYVTVNMAGIKEIVDAVGGIDVVSPLTFSYDGYDFYEGEVVHLDGNAALAFARMRYEDLAGDTGRQARQRIVIEGVIQKAASPTILTRYQEIMGSLSNNVQTNMQMGDYTDLAMNDYLTAARNIQPEQIDGSGSTAADGIWYHYVPDEELWRVQDLLRTELELE